MKKLFASIAIAVAFAASAAAEENIVNIYNWSDYIADDTVAKFEADSGQVPCVPENRQEGADQLRKSR